MAEIFKFPYDARRRVHSQKPRRSKNGTPEERAAKTGALETTPADVVSMSAARADADSKVDGRKLRGSPLREKVSPISLAATIVGKMHTAKLKGEVLDREAAWQEGWVQMLQEGAAAARFVADEIDKARVCLVMTTEEFKKAYDQASPEIQQIIADKIRAFKAKSETSDFPVNLPVSDLGQPVLNLATGLDREAPAPIEPYRSRPCELMDILDGD
jgi:hypothetical protein